MAAVDLPPAGLKRLRKVSWNGARNLTALALLLAGAACSSTQFRIFGSDEEKQPWTEIEAKLPNPPKPENLIPFEASGATPHRFYIDAPSLSVDGDGVVRYTMVVKTAGGATNVSFEGIRCETREQKYYAVGRSDGSWAPARDAQWRRVDYKDVNRHHWVLYADFFCPERHVRMATAKQILESLRRSSASLR